MKSNTLEGDLEEIIIQSVLDMPPGYFHTSYVRIRNIDLQITIQIYKYHSIPFHDPIADIWHQKPLLEQ